MKKSHDDIYPLYPAWGGYLEVPVWFDEKKLAEIGFIIDDRTCHFDRNKRKEWLPKNTFIVLEYNGETYQVVLRRAEMEVKKTENDLKENKKDKKLQEKYEQAQIDLRTERSWSSRLFAIDVGLDADKLRERYPDRSKFIIMRGIVSMVCFRLREMRPPEIPEVAGYISHIRIEKINVPLEYRNFFDPILLQRHDISEPRYKVRVAYGSRFEPWIQSVDKLLK